MKKRAGAGNIDTIFVLVIFSTFAFSVLMVLALSAGIYKNINDISRESEDARTALSYVRTKIRNLDSAGSFFVDAQRDAAGYMGNTDDAINNALYICEDIGSTRYVTVIYAYDGWLREMFCEAGFDFAPQDGMRVAEAGDLRFELWEGGVIAVFADALHLTLLPRGGRAQSYEGALS